MMKNRRIFLLGVIVLLSLSAFWGCPKKAQITTAPETAPAAKAEPTGEQMAEPSKEAKPEAKDESMGRASAAASGLLSVYFDFDRSFVRDDARASMKANAEWLKANPRMKVRIEGNCDDRGTKEYNQALGQRRATSAKKYLTDMGISEKRVLLISYGKEKPVCNEPTEGCWQKNRRGDFIAVAE